MRNVVLPREVVERVWDFMYPHVFDLQGAEWAPARALLAALDAALAAPEPFVRLLTSWRELREERDTFTSDWDDVEEAIFLLTGKWATP